MGSGPEAIESHLTSVEEADFSDESVKAMKVACEALAKTFEKQAKRAKEDRAVVLELLGVSFTVECKSARAEYEMRLR